MNVLFQFEEGNISPISIQCTADWKMIKVLEALKIKVNSESDLINLRDFSFLYDGKNINTDLTISQIRKNPSDSFMIINVSQKSKIMKCPLCIGDTCFIRIENYGVKFFGCKKGHNPQMRTLEDYESTQKMDYNKIICQKCNRTQKSDIKEFYKCLKCSETFKKAVYYCNDHSKTHAENLMNEHKIIKYSEKNYICSIHYNEFTSYCTECKYDLCNKCEKNHFEKKHKIYKYDDIIPKVKKIKNELEELNKKIAEVKMNIDVLKRMIHSAEYALNNYYNISMDLIRKYETYNQQYRNYHVISNINSLSDSNAKVMKNLEIILNGGKTKKDYLNQFESLINIYYSTVENYLSKPAVEDANKAYMTSDYQIEINNNFNQSNKDNSNKTNFKEIALNEGDAFKKNKKPHDISNNKKNNKKQ